MGSIAAAASIAGLSPNTVYHVRIVATSGAGTTAGSDVAFRTQRACVPGGAPVPSARTEAASGVRATEVTLNATVAPKGCATTYQFRYGKTAAYGSATAVASAGSGARSISVTASITGLAPNAVYHFRIVGVSGAGTATGSDETFRTRAPSAVSSVQIVGRRVSVTRGFVAIVRLRCAVGSRPCEGFVTILHARRPIGAQRFRVAANTSSVVRVHIDNAGRKLVRAQRRLRAEIIARRPELGARKVVTLVRT